MKKWLILGSISVLLALYGLFLVLWFGGGFAPEPAPQTTAPAQTTAPVQATTSPTLPPETTLPTTTATPYVPVMSEDYVLTARHAFVYDCREGKYLYTLGDQQEQIAPASLTKLLTALVALELLDPGTLVTAGEEALWVDPASSLATVLPDDRLSVEMLIQGMMMQSGNDAAYTLAVAGGRSLENDPTLDARQAVQVFMDHVNVRAAQLGLEQTHFVTPDGLDAEGHLTSCQDLLQISLLALEDPILSKYAAVARCDVVFDSGKEVSWTSTNMLLHPELECYCPLAEGLKTGYTSKAGACLLAVFRESSKTMIVGILGAPTYEDRCFDALYLFEQYR